MRKFKVKVDGEEYIVEVEEIGAGQSQSKPQVVRRETSASPSVEPRRKASNKPAQIVDTSAGGGGVKAPMPGKILEIKVEAGQQVQQGQILLVLEAMKLENNISAPSAGKVARINVEVGANVEAGDLLVEME